MFQDFWYNEVAQKIGHHPLWLDRLPELSQEKTPTEASVAMWTTGVIFSTAVKGVSAQRGHVTTEIVEEKRLWAELCLAQIGSPQVSEPLYSLSRVHLPSADPVEPLSNWIIEKPAQLQQPIKGMEVLISPPGKFTDIHTDGVFISCDSLAIFSIDNGYIIDLFILVLLLSPFSTSARKLNCKIT
jgi:hypothetical protein